METHKMGVSVSDMAYEIEANTRTIYRDLQALQYAGFPIYTEREGNQSLWKLISKPGISNVFPFTLTELMSLHFCRDMLAGLEGTVFKESFGSLSIK